jgi:crotonobetainyl-CoA:carnitine CoA-transferase CaiB-like acyl-CoA transferase
VLTLAEAFDDPQARHNQMLVEVDHPVAGSVKVTGSPIRLDGVPARALPPAAVLGQHTKPILHELGVDAGTIEQMVEAGTAVVS